MPSWDNNGYMGHQPSVQMAEQGLQQRYNTRPSLLSYQILGRVSLTSGSRLGVSFTSLETPRQSFPLQLSPKTCILIVKLSNKEDIPWASWITSLNDIWRTISTITRRWISIQISRNEVRWKFLSFTKNHKHYHTFDIRYFLLHSIDVILHL